MSNMPTDADFQRIKDLIFAGRKMEAIKAYRRTMGADLSEAKSAVEEMTLELQASDPDSFRKPAGKGCAASTTAALLFAVTLAWSLWR